MLKTISISHRISAQGIVVRTLDDGRVTISTGTQLLTGWPIAPVRASGSQTASHKLN